MYAISRIHYHAQRETGKVEEMAQSKQRKREEKTNSQNSPGKLGFVVAGGFVVVVLLGVVISMLAGAGGTASDPRQTVGIEPSPISALLDTTPILPADPTETAISFSPSGQATTPTPAWDQLYSGLPAPAGGWNLLVLHTNDTWGYIYPCG